MDEASFAGCGVGFAAGLGFALLAELGFSAGAVVVFLGAVSFLEVSGQPKKTENMRECMKM